MLKKLICLIGISLLFGSGVASADCYDNCSCFTPRFYVEGYAGYAFNDWKSSFNEALQPLTPEGEGITIINHKCLKHPNQFAGGGSFGYQFDPCFAIEFGGFSCCKTDYDFFTQSTAGSHVQSSRNKGSITNWFLYTAARLNWSLRWIPKLDLFGKFGVAFRYGRIQNTNVSIDSAATPETTRQSQSSNMSFPSAIAGGGVQYWIFDWLSINGQYLYVPASVGSTTVIANFDHFRFPHTHIVTFGLTFAFPSLK